ncbi:MAG: hypothetical protein ACTSSE_18230 [Candidatus Thorarchaeota archaeon]
MNKGQKISIVIVVIIVFVGVGLFSVGGFTGTTATWNRTVYDGNVYAPDSDTYQVADIEYPEFIAPAGVLVQDNPVGITAQIAGQPQTIETEVKDPIEVDNGDGTVDIYQWEIRTMEFGVDFQCTGIGTLSPTGMEFYLRLANNYDSVWLDADSFGYVLGVWVKEYEVKQNGLAHSILPSAQGAFFQLYSVDDGHEVSPPGAYAAGMDLETLKQFQTVDIKFTVDHFRPAVVWTLSYEAAHVYYTINMQVVVLGHWENVVPTHTQGAAPDSGFNFLGWLGDLWEDIYAILPELIWGIAIIAIVILILYFVVRKAL